MERCDLPAVRVLDATGSTNDDVKALAHEGAPAGTAVAARIQTCGRGRRGHAWSSGEGTLALSVLLRPQVSMGLFTGLPAVCSLGVLDALREDAGVREASLKWPNDVVLARAKLGGVLVEAGSSEQGPFAVCGVGLNLERPCASSEEDSLDSPLALPRAYLQDAGVRVDFDELAAAVRDRVVEKVAAWEDAVWAGRAKAGPLAPVLDEYFDSIAALGHEVDVLTPAGDLVGAGMFAGIDCWGRATVRYADGQTCDYTSEQVSLRPREQ